MALFFSALINGIAYGVVVTLLGLGFSVSLGAARVANFAQGEVYMIGAFAGAGVAQLTGNLFIAILAGLGSGALANYAIYHLVFRRLRHYPMIGTLVVGVGAAFAIEAVWGQLFGVALVPFPTIRLASRDFSLLGARVPESSLVLIAVTAVLLVAVYLALFRTTFGLKVRALQDNATAGEVIGLDAPRLQGGVFALAGGLSGVAGVLIAWQVGAYQFTMGETGIGLAFVAAVIGGLGSVPGALIGGVLIGIVRDVGGVYYSPLTEVYPYVLLMAMLLIRPTGLFGRALDIV